MNIMVVDRRIYMNHAIVNLLYGNLYMSASSTSTFVWKKMTASTINPGTRFGMSMISFDSTRVNPLIPNCILLIGGQNSLLVVLSDVFMACPLFASSYVTWTQLAPLPSSPSMFQQAILVNQRLDSFFILLSPFLNVSLLL